MAKRETTDPQSSAEPTRRVQLTLPECKQLADLLLADVVETLDLPDVDGRGNEQQPITIEALRAAAPKIKRLLKLVDDTEAIEAAAAPAAKPGKSDDS